MKKFLLSLLAIAWAYSTSFAQSKVFKEVSDEIATQVTTLMQDNAVIGYLAFTRLEKASEGQYNYKISIMDENLNDIGTVNFQEKPLILLGVAFEQDVLCLSYFRSNMLDQRFKKEKKLKAASSNFKHDVMLQFLNLEGKIIETVSSPVDIKTHNVLTIEGYAATGKLKHHRLISVPQTGFAWMVGDEARTHLSVYQPTGKRITQQPVKDDVLPDMKLLAAGKNVYFIANAAQNKNVSKNSDPNAFSVINYNITDSSFSKVTVKDKQSHQLGILKFDVDPASGHPYISGYLKGKNSNANWYSGRGLARGFFAGVFSINVNGTAQKDVKELYTYWDDDSKSDIKSNGYFKDLGSYGMIQTSFKDYQGNTYFTADGVKKKLRPGCIASSIILSPLVTPTIGILIFGGTQKAKMVDPILLKMDPKGMLSWHTPFEGESSRYIKANYPISLTGSTRNYYTAVDHEQKQHYIVVNETESSTIYNVTKKKTVRTITLKDKSIVREVIPAKEGHLMITEYNKKEKYTRISIEAL